MSDIDEFVRSPCRLIATLNRAMLAIESGKFEGGSTNIRIRFKTGIGGADIRSFSDRVARVIYGPSAKVTVDTENNRYKCSSINSNRAECYMSMHRKVILCESDLTIVLEYEDIRI